MPRNKNKPKQHKPHQPGPGTKAAVPAPAPAPAPSSAPAPFVPEVHRQRVICDDNIQSGTVDISLMCYVPADNQAIIQLYEDPEQKSLKLGESNVETAKLQKIWKDISAKLLYIRSLPFDMFWCAMMEPDVKEFLNTFPLSFDPILLEYIGRKNYNDLLRDLSETLTSILKSVLLIYHRMSSRIENKEETSYEMSLKKYGTVVYDGFLTDTAKMLDLAGIYGKSNPELLRILINNFFELEPRYLEDMNDSIEKIAVEFNAIVKETLGVFEHLKESADQQKQDALQHMLDLVQYIFSFASVFPAEASDALFNKKAYLWLPLIQHYAIKMARNVTQMKPVMMRLANEVVANTMQAGVALADRAVLSRGKFVKGDY